MSDERDTSCDLSRLSPFAPELANVIASVASDIALVVDAEGVIRNVAVGHAEGVGSTARDWVGRPWVETVTRETRAKIEHLLQEAVAGAVTQRREVNHLGVNGGEIPIAYAAIRLGGDGPVLAVGRELRMVAALQQRFLEAQAEIEREYWKQRQAESRYRTLFQVATDAVLIVDAATLRIVDANRAAAELFDVQAGRLVGSHAAVGIDKTSRAAVEELLLTARTTGKPGEIRARLLGRQGVVHVAATPFRSDDAMLLLVRASRSDVLEAGAVRLARMVERMPDALLVCDAGGRVLTVNHAFVELVGLSDAREVQGRSLGAWFDPAGDDLRALLAAAQKAGIVTGMEARLHVKGGTSARVTVSAVLLPEGEQTCVGMILRPQAREAAASGPLRELATAIERLGEQLGRDDLAALLRASAAIAEKHLLDAALRRCGEDRLHAARLLGLTPADLEARLQAHGLRSPPGPLDGADGVPPDGR